MTRYAVALGSNLGERIEYLRSAVGALAGLGEVIDVSGLYETAPVGGRDQDPFLNAVVVLDSDLSPRALLEGLHAIENQHGRQRTTKWGPRTLDLDIVAYDGPPLAQADLTIPHPRAATRLFVLRPLADVWPEARVGESKLAAGVLDEVSDQEVDLLAKMWVSPPAPRPGTYWVGVQLVWFLGIALAMIFDGSLPEGGVGALHVIGLLMAAIGGLLAFSSMRRLGSSLTAVPEPLREATLIETGPYSLARHPIYGGVALFLLGASLVVDSVVAVILSVGLGAFFWFKSSYEERQLRIAYPRYSAYQRRVGKRLIPFLI